MANYRAIANGNWSNLAIWQDDSLGYFANSTVLPTTDDNVYSNNFTVTIDGTRNASTIRNTAFTPPTFLGAMSIPQMTSNTTPSGAAAASSVQSGFAIWNAFDRNTGTAWQSNTTNSGWLSYQFPTGRIIKRYGFFTGTNNNGNIRTWTFEGSNNGSTWVVLDTQTNFVTGVSTFFSFDISANTTSYTFYRINVTAVQAGGSNPSIPELEMSEVTNLYGGIVAGGRFTFANGGDLTCTTSPAVILGTTTPVLEMNLASPNTATFRGSVLTIANIQGSNAILLSSNGTLNLIGNYSADGVTTNSGGAKTLINSTGNGTLNIIGNLNNTSSIGGSQNSNTLGLTGGVLNLTGSVSDSATGGINGLALTISSSSAIVNITGNITNQSSHRTILINGGNLNVIGNTTGGSVQPAILNSTINTTINILGTTTSGSGSPAIQGLVTTLVIIRGNVVNTDTYCAVLAGRVVIDNNVTSWQFKDSTNTITRTLYTAGVNLGNPLQSDVRNLVTYGPSLELTGTTFVPSPANTRRGVPVDNTVGTADLTANDIFYAIETSNIPVAVRLRNISTVETFGTQIASYDT
jgi:hypothetical protein